MTKDENDLVNCRKQLQVVQHYDSLHWRMILQKDLRKFDVIFKKMKCQTTTDSASPSPSFHLINLFVSCVHVLGLWLIVFQRLHPHTSICIYTYKDSIQSSQFTYASITQCCAVTDAIYFTKDLIYLFQFSVLYVRALVPCSLLVFFCYLCHILSPTFTCSNC